ncbi:hypothetical protein [Streptomyces flaveolus]|uniref:hypothetical protein n=1 Tax=Streptomyces flaveolus TaxID=67297 RepID=UPI0033FE5AF2
MPRFQRTAVTALSVAAIAATALATAPTASAAGYRCTTSKMTIDDPAYSGPWPDNWSLAATICAKRSGSYVYAYAKVSVNGPNFYDKGPVFDAARWVQQIKHSRSGPDTVQAWKNFPGIKNRIENNTRSGSYTTSAIRWTAGNRRGLGDGYLQLDWDNDGKGYRSYHFTASPAV